MNDKRKGFLLIFLGVVLMALVVLVVVLGVEQTEKEVPCVDGFRRANLEGIMCEGVEASIFGMDLGESVGPEYLLLFAFFVLGFLLFLLGLAVLMSRRSK